MSNLRHASSGVHENKTFLNLDRMGSGSDLNSVRGCEKVGTCVRVSQTVAKTIPRRVGSEDFERTTLFPREKVEGFPLIFPATETASIRCTSENPVVRTENCLNAGEKVEHQRVFGEVFSQLP